MSLSQNSWILKILYFKPKSHSTHDDNYELKTKSPWGVRDPIWRGICPPPRASYTEDGNKETSANLSKVYFIKRICNQKSNKNRINTIFQNRHFCLWAIFRKQGKQRSGFGLETPSLSSPISYFNLLQWNYTAVESDCLSNLEFKDNRSPLTQNPGAPTLHCLAHGKCSPSAEWHICSPHHSHLNRCTAHYSDVQPR